MTSTPEQHESGQESVVSTLAGFAKKVVEGLRGDADDKMDALSQAKKAKWDSVGVNLAEVERLFSGETDVVGDKSELELGVEQAKALVNLARSLFGEAPLGEGEEVDLSRDMQTDKEGNRVLKLGDKEVRYKDLDFSQFKDVGERLIKAGQAAIGYGDRLDSKSCWDWIKGVYDKAGVAMGEVVYQDSMNGKTGMGRFDPSYLVPGAWIYFYNGNQYGGEHSALLESYDPSTGKAWVLSYTGGTQGTPRRHQVELNAPEGELMGRITQVRLPGKVEDIKRNA